RIRMRSVSSKFGFSLVVCLFIVFTGTSATEIPHSSDTSKQKANLAKILKLLPPDRTSNGRVSFLDETFEDWLARTGELPPNFDKMPSIPFLPNPFILDEGG